MICYCDDCQAFGRFLGRRDITDAWGGTDIFQMAPSQVRFEDAQTLDCIRLSEKGMYRWSCRECKTPVGNTMGPRVPFVGLIHSIMDHTAIGLPRDELVGAPLGYMHTRSAQSGGPPHAERKLRAIGRSVRKLAHWWLTGAGSPSPFFDTTTRAPQVVPRVLGVDERRALATKP